MTVPELESARSLELAAAEQLLEALNDFGVTDGLGPDPLRPTGDDRDRGTTLWISREFLVALRNAGVMETFMRLPRHDQACFLGVIGATSDPEVRRGRIGSLVGALSQSPLAKSGQPAARPHGPTQP